MARIDAEGLRRKREKLEAELTALRAQEQNAAEQRNAIAGRAVLDHAVKDVTFALELRAILDKALTRRKERRLFGLDTPEATAAAEVLAAERVPSGLPDVPG